MKCLSPRDPFSWLPVACFLPPLAPASMLFHGASVDNSVRLWLHLKTCGYFLLKEAKRVMVFNWLLVFTCTSVSGWLFRLILHRQSNSFETSDLNVKAMCYSKKSIPEKLWNSPLLHPNLQKLRKSENYFYIKIVPHTLFLLYSLARLQFMLHLQASSKKINLRHQIQAPNYGFR